MRLLRRTIVVFRLRKSGVGIERSDLRSILVSPWGRNSFPSVIDRAIGEPVLMYLDI